MGTNFAGSIDDKNSAFGYMVHHGSRVISLASRKQPMFSLFTIKVEYVAANAKTIWSRRIPLDLN